ncbi:MAG: glycosyltransferase family 1 protein [Aquihabitans sp.]
MSPSVRSSQDRPEPGTAPLPVLFDATSLLDTPTGVGVFAREVLGGLAARDDVAMTAFAVSWRGRDRLARAVPAGIDVRSRPIPARVARPLWRHGTWPSARWMAGPARVVHGPNHVVPPGGGATELVTVHDLTAVHYPEMCTADVRQWPALLSRSLDRGAWIHAVSHAVGDELRDRYPNAADRVVVIPNGMRRPPAEAPASAAAVGRHLAGGDRYVLALGTVEPRKDLPTLVAAFDILAADDPDLRLVIAGPDGWGAEALTSARDRAVHRRRITRLGWVGGDQRLALLRGASVLAYPSRYEGFGLVPLEALAVGTPVVATKVPAVTEVVADAALLVDVGDVDGLAAALAETLDGGQDTARRLVAGQARVEAYDWETTVDQLAALYHHIA